MKFTVESNELQKALMKISGVVPSKSTLPILENILFFCFKGKLGIDDRHAFVVVRCEALESGNR